MQNELDGNYHPGVLTILEQLAENPPTPEECESELESIENLIRHSY